MKKNRLYAVHIAKLGNVLYNIIPAQKEQLTWPKTGEGEDPVTVAGVKADLCLICPALGTVREGWAAQASQLSVSCLSLVLTGHLKVQFRGRKANITVIKWEENYIFSFECVWLEALQNNTGSHVRVYCNAATPQCPVLPKNQHCNKEICPKNPV